jgi:hypothetical protein
MSGRQVRPPKDRMTGGEASGASVQGDGVDENMLDDDASVGPTGRPRRTAAANHPVNGWTRGTRSRGHTTDEMDEEEEEGTDFDGDDENDEDAQVPDESEEEDDYDDDEAMVEDDLEDHLPRTRIVKLKVSPTALNKILAMTPPLSTPEKEDNMVDMPDAPPVDTKVQNHTPASSGRQSTPEAVIKVSQPLTPSAATSITSLAFRGSPEKPFTTARAALNVGAPQ